jgi:hypothetical protein
MNDQSPSGSSQTNPQAGSTANATAQQKALYFLYPDTAELFELPVESIEPVRQEIALMSKLSEDLIEARQALGIAHAAWQDQQSNVALRPQLESNLKTAIQNEEAATDKIHKELEETPAFNKDGVWELLPLMKTSSGKQQYAGQRFTYVRSSKVKNHFRRYKLDSDKPNQLKSFLVKDQTTGKYKIDHDRLHDSLNEAFKKAKFSHEWKTPPWGKEWVPEFAESWNKNCTFKSPDSPHEMCEFKGGAQFLRFFAGAGASAKVENTFKSFDDVLKMRGEVAASAKAKGELGGVLAEGNVHANIYIPWNSGLELYIPTPTQTTSGAVSWAGSSPNTTLGFFRISLKTTAEASCGASLLAEGGVEFKLGRDGKTQQVKGSRAKRNATQMQQPKLNVTETKVEGDVGADLKAFAGVEAEASIQGSLDWRRPQAKKDDWNSFASVKPGVSGQAGIGAQAAFHITYDKQFRIFMKAALCAGVGLKGEIEASIDAVNMIEFAWWAKTQIAYAGDQNLKYFAPEAFKIFVTICTLAIAEGKELKTYLGKDFETLRGELVDFIRTEPQQFLNAIKNAHDELLNSVAEVKGYIIYALQGLGEQFQQWQSEVSDSISHVLSSAQITNELHNIYQFVSPEVAEKGSAQTARSDIASTIGADQLAEIEGRIRDDPAPGFAFAFNDSPAYGMQQGTNVAWLDPTTTPDGSQMA